MSVTFDDVGTITIHTAPPVTLARAKYGAYRQLRDNYREQLRLLTEKGELVTQMSSDPDAYKQKDVEKAVRDADEFMTVVFPELRRAWIVDAVKLLGDRPLPDDVDEWPADLVEDAALPGKMLTHWRTVPLVHGGQATNSRSKTGNA